MKERALGYSNVQFIASEETSLGMVYLRQRELLSQPGTVLLELLLDHALLMSSCSTHSERARLEPRPRIIWLRAANASPCSSSARP